MNEPVIHMAARSPIGRIQLHWDTARERLCGVQLPRSLHPGQDDRFQIDMPSGASERMSAMLEVLGQYFAGVPILDGLAWIDQESMTPFRRAVARAVADIPFGEVRSYSAVAEAVGRPKGGRAVGQAMGANRFPIFVPCHRVVAANGIGGFGPGLAMKRALLAHEGWYGKSL